MLLQDAKAFQKLVFREVKLWKDSKNVSRCSLRETKPLGIKQVRDEDEEHKLSKKRETQELMFELSGPKAVEQIQKLCSEGQKQ